MSEPVRHKLATPEIQAALRIAGLPPARTSPFAGLSPPAAIEQQMVSSLHEKQVLNGNGNVTEAWRGALATLTSPAYRVSLDLGTNDGSFVIDYYAAKDGMVGYSASGPAEHTITFPCTPAVIMQLLGQWLNWTDSPRAGRSQLNLRAAELVALAAVVDAVKEERLRALIDRRQADADVLSRDQLVYELEAGSTADARWFAGILKRHTPPAYHPDPQNLNEGVQALAARGWLRLVGNRLALEPALTEIASGMANLNPLVRFAIGPAGEAGPELLAMSSLTSFWTLEFLAGEDGRAWAFAQSLDGNDIQEVFKHLLDMLPKAEPAATWSTPVALATSMARPLLAPPLAPPPAPPPPLPVQTRSLAPSQTVPKPPPPPPTEPIPRLCAKCGKRLTPGRKFCTGCGAPA